MESTIQSLTTAMNRKGYAVYTNDSKPFNLNIVGVRSEDNTPNVFNDVFYVLWKYDGRWNLYSIDGTTEPGLYWLNNPMNINGTAIVKPGQYKGLWKVGDHKGKYEALVQKGDITVVRDYNKDNRYDYESGREETGDSFGINFHHASYTGESTQVDEWSAGCQVASNIHSYEIFMEICGQALNYFPNSFTYTLLEEKDLK